MLNPISHAIGEIQMTIPPPILTEVFGREDIRNWRRTAPVSIDEMIKSKVLRPRVLKDANLLGGRHAMISLESVRGYQQDNYSSIYDIPPQLTGHREILSVLSVHYLPYAMTSSGGSIPMNVTTPSTQSDIGMAAQRVMDSYANVPHVSTAHAELVGYNVVLIRDQTRPSQAYGLRCLLANEENLSNIQPRSYRSFSKACILATKSYIYNQLIIRLGSGMLEQGQSLGEFKNIVDSYSEAEEQYQDFLTNELQKVLLMNDVQSYDRFISFQVHPGL